MRGTLVVAVVTWAVIAAIAATTSAEPEPVHATDLVSRLLVLGAGEVAVSLTVELELAPRRVASPLTLAPDLWFGVTRRWTIGVIHSHASVDQIGAGASLCVRDCDQVYTSAGLDVRWSWRDGPLAIAPRARVLVRGFDPWKPAITVGALARWTRGRFAITSDPYLRLGVANRDLGNRAALVVPIWLGVQPTCRWLVTLHTGWDGELATLHDGWHVPVALGVTARVTEHIDVGMEAGFPSLLGPQNDYKQRALTATALWRR